MAPNERSTAAAIAGGAVGVSLAICTGTQLYPEWEKWRWPNEAPCEGRTEEGQVMAGVIATVEAFKLAERLREFPDSMLLNRRERTALDGGLGAGDDFDEDRDDFEASRTYPYRAGTSHNSRSAGHIGTGRTNIFGALALDRGNRVLKEELLAYMRRFSTGKSSAEVVGEWWWPAHKWLVEAIGGQVARIPLMDDACQQALGLLFACADYEVDDELSESELLRFFQMYKHYFECYTSTEKTFFQAVLKPLLDEIVEGPELTEQELMRGANVRPAALRVLRVEHPPVASDGGNFEAMVAVYQRGYTTLSSYDQVESFRDRGDRKDDSGQWLQAEAKIGATEPRPTGGYLRHFWWTEGVEFKSKRSEFKCFAPGEVLVKLVNDEWAVDNVEGEGRIKISAPASRLGRGGRREWRARTDQPSWAHWLPFLAPDYDGPQELRVGLYKGGLECLGSDGMQTVVVLTVDRWEDFPRPKSQRLSVVRRLAGNPLRRPGHSYIDVSAHDEQDLDATYYR